MPNHKNGLNCSLLLCPKRSVIHYHSRTLWCIASAGLDYEEHPKNSVALFFLPNRVWGSSTYGRNVFWCNVKRQS